MSRRREGRTLTVRTVVFCVGLLLAAQAFTQVKMLSPEDGAILIGPTTFAFEVPAGPDLVERIDVYADGVLAGTALGPDWTLQWEAPPGLVNARIVAAVYVDGALAQRIEIHTSDVVVNELIDVVAVELYPVVTDRRGAYVAELSRDDFVVLDRGQPVEILDFSYEVASLTVSVLIDTSESMKGKLSAVQEAAVEFVDSLDPDDRVAVYSFNHGTDRITDWSTDRQQAKSAIRSLDWAGSTAMYDAITTANRDLQTQRGRKVMLVFSDGRDERSMASLERAIASSQLANTIVYTIASGESQADLDARSDLRELASDTGGEAHEIAKLKNLASVFDQVLADIRSQYSLSFAPHNQTPGTHSVRVRAKDSQYVVRCRSSYVIGG